MSRLPAPLQPAWPLLKRVHRLLSLVMGVMLRRLAPALGDRGVPRSATTSSVDTARGDPDHVAVHAGAPAERIHRSVAVGDPPGHWVFAGARTARTAPTFVLDVKGGRLVGEYGAAVTAGNVLDYETSPYFGIAGWREHPIFLRPGTGAVEQVDGTILSLTARGTAVNYYHFMYDSIARLGILEQALPGQRFDAVVVPHQASYQKQLLEMVGVNVPLIQPRAGHAVRAERLLVPSVPNAALDAPRATVDWLRRRLPPRDVDDTPRRLYLTRGSRRNSRRYVEEQQLWPHLEQRGFVRLDPGACSVQEQIDIFHGADIVVGPHGAALTNITFCSPGAKVLEMFAPTYVHLGLWAIAEAVGDLEYRYLVGDGPMADGGTMVGVLDDISIPVERVVTAVDALIAG